MTQPTDNRTCAYVYPPRGTQGYGADVCGLPESHLAHTQGHPFTPVSEEPKQGGDAQCADAQQPVCVNGTKSTQACDDGGTRHPAESPKDAVKDKREDDCPCDDHEHGTQVGKQCLCCDMNAPVKDEGFDAWHSRFEQFMGEVDAHTFALYRALREEGWLAARRSIPPMDVRKAAVLIFEAFEDAARGRRETTITDIANIIADELSQLTRGDE